MNKILSQAIRKAVSDYTPEVNQDPKDKRLDLFSLNSETELFQNSKGITISKNLITSPMKFSSSFQSSYFSIFRNY